MCDCRPERAKALPKHHSFALSGRIYPFPTTQGVALGYELVALSGRFNRTSKIIRPVRMKIPLVLIRSKYQRKLPLARELFLVASREIEQIYSNLSNLFPICLICTDLYDFCPLGHSFFSHHIATYREHHFQS